MSVAKPTISLFKYQKEEKKNCSYLSSVSHTSVTTKGLRFSKLDRGFRFAIATTCTMVKMFKLHKRP